MRPADHKQKQYVMPKYSELMFILWNAKEGIVKVECDGVAVDGKFSGKTMKHIFARKLGYRDKMVDLLSHTADIIDRVIDPETKHIMEAQKAKEESKAEVQEEVTA